jgi:hypothetical protein
MRNPLQLVSSLVALSSLLSAAAIGCAANTNEPTPGTGELLAPEVVALSTYEASIGTLVEVYGENFPYRSSGRVMLAFQGNFEADDGSVYPVDDEFEASVVDAGTLRWDSFGPYRVPFGPTGNQTGEFVGIVFARIVDDDGNVTESTEPLEATFRVKPSLLVHELQPLSASCGAPVQRALGGAAYRMRVEALGFEPESFTYTIAAPAADIEPVSIRHPATGRYDVVGEYGDLIFPSVPENLLSYGAVLTVTAADVTGQIHGSTFAIGVHRPLEFFYNGNVTVAEVMAPVPVSACIPGGINGRDASYNESMSETRERSYSTSWNESWLSSHTVASSSSQTVGLSETNGVGFATTDGESFRWHLGGEVGGEVGLSKLVSLSMKTTFGIASETSRQVNNSRNRTTGLNESSTTTDTESATETAGASTGETFAWSVNSTETVSRDFGGQIIAGKFGVFYRQTLRLLRRGALVAYNQCGSAEVVGDVDFTDWSWSPDLAMGDSCPPLPASNLPDAECLVPPCAGE